MAKTLEFYFDFGSPNAYLAHRLLPALARRTGAELVYRPILLGGVFQATGNASPMTVPAKAAHGLIDLERFAKKHAIAYRMNPRFPINTLQLMRGAVVAEEDGCLSPYVDAVFDATWRDGRDTGDLAVVAEALGAAGLEPKRLLGRIGEDAVKGKLKSLTEAAVARGVFGAPTFFVGDAMFFGKDRLDDLADALAAA